MMRIQSKYLGFFLALALAACGEQAAPDGKKTDYQIGDRLPVATAKTSAQASAQTATQAPAQSAPAKPVHYREINWDELIPPGWDPAKAFAKLNLDQLQDADPRAEAALAEMRRIWDEAPINAKLNGQAVRIPGFVVPLDVVDGKLREFLLVPYFGGCIHVPPPPANQIIHARVATPLDDTKAMDAIWVNGVLATAYSNSEMGKAGYRMDVQKVEAFQ